MRKTLTFLLILALLTSALSLAFAAQYTATVKEGSLHLRAKPEKHAKSLGRYKSGTEVELLADSDDYAKVKTPDGKIGYMMKKYLDIKNGFPQEEAPRAQATNSPYAEIRKAALARGIDPYKPMLALTFDDGPMPDSKLVLDALKAHNARATFFVLGKNIEGHESILRRMADEGHQIGSHSWSHPHLEKLSASSVRSQMTRTMDKIEEITGQKVTMMRPPYGSTNRNARKVIEGLGLPIILWTVDSKDWASRNSEAVINVISSQAENGAIILCHDVWASTGKAMETLIPSLMEKGFQLVTVAELMSFRNEAIKPGLVYTFLDVSKIEQGIELPSNEEATVEISN